MFIPRSALEHAQLEVTLDEHGLCIEGHERMPDAAIKNVKNIAAQLQYTPQEHDELMSYVASVTVWRVLKSITSI